MDFILRVDLYAKVYSPHIDTYKCIQCAAPFETQIESLEKELAKVRSQKEQQVSGMSKQYEDRQRRRDKEVHMYVRM